MFLQGFVFFMSVFMHLKFSLNDEAATRDSFFDSITIQNLKNSLQQTLDTLPEPLVVLQEREVVYANTAFKQVTTITEEEQAGVALSNPRESLKKKAVLITKEATSRGNGVDLLESEEGIQSNVDDFLV